MKIIETYKKLKTVDKILEDIQSLHKKLASYSDSDRYFIEVGKEICRYELNNDKPKKWFSNTHASKAKAAKMLGIQSKVYERYENHKNYNKFKENMRRWRTFGTAENGRTVDYREIKND